MKKLISISAAFAFLLLPASNIKAEVGLNDAAIPIQLYDGNRWRTSRTYSFKNNELLFFSSKKPGAPHPSLAGKISGSWRYAGKKPLSTPVEIVAVSVGFGDYEKEAELWPVRDAKTNRLAPSVRIPRGRPLRAGYKTAALVASERLPASLDIYPMLAVRLGRLVGKIVLPATRLITRR
ncbi:MAG: hypothetical protein HYT79_07065 [Elusimicrobia bacterium]|nr:hypothetical protein [Elusimicrobiota bacterium]